MACAVCAAGCLCRRRRRPLLWSASTPTLRRRWERAERFGLAPPKDVRDLVMRLGGPGGSADQSLWHHRVLGAGDGGDSS